MPCAHVRVPSDCSKRPHARTAAKGRPRKTKNRERGNPRVELRQRRRAGRPTGSYLDVTSTAAGREDVNNTNRREAVARRGLSSLSNFQGSFPSFRPPPLPPLSRLHRRLRSCSPPSLPPSTLRCRTAACAKRKAHHVARPVATPRPHDAPTRRLPAGRLVVLVGAPGGRLRALRVPRFRGAGLGAGAPGPLGGGRGPHPAPRRPPRRPGRHRRCVPGVQPAGGCALQLPPAAGAVHPPGRALVRRGRRGGGERARERLRARAPEAARPRARPRGWAGATPLNAALALPLLFLVYDLGYGLFHRALHHRSVYAAVHKARPPSHPPPPPLRALALPRATPPGRGQPRLLRCS